MLSLNSAPLPSGENQGESRQKIRERLLLHPNPLPVGE
jgi:hypothetical protein